MVEEIAVQNIAEPPANLAHMNTALVSLEESTRKNWIVTGEQTEPINKPDEWDVQFVNGVAGTTVKLNGKHIPGLQNARIDHECGECVRLHLDIVIMPTDILRVKSCNAGDAA